MAGLPDVNITILDGGLGLLPPSLSGLHAKVGVSSAGNVGGIVSLSSPDQITPAFGTGPLVDALADSFMTGAQLVYAVRANGDIAGTVSAVTATKTGTGNMTAAGPPLDSYEVIVEILDAGTLNEATFRYSLDGGDTYSPKITVPQTGSYVITGTGLTLTFTADAVTPANSFKVGDKYTFTAKAPGASVTSVNAALDVLLAAALEYEFIHVVGNSDAAMWAALSSKAATAEGNFRYIHIVAEARGPNAGETVDQWVTALETMSTSFASTRVSVVAGRPEISDMLTGRSVDRNGAGVLLGRVSKIPEQRSAGRVMDGSLPGIIRLNPVGINEAQILRLDNARYSTFRQYVGLNGFYITNARMMAEVISDFRYTETRRVMDKACRLVRTAALRFAQAEATPEGLDALEAQLESPLNIMVADKQILQGRVVIPRDQDIISTPTLKAKVRIVPVPIMRWIEVEIGLENPLLSKGGEQQ
ncbi:MAG: DUF2586 domain-containing protein [Firmicutes bacterium]|nr:DUF2586 domain-containing protein [Bacillota bacterium]